MESNKDRKQVVKGVKDYLDAFIYFLNEIEKEKKEMNKEELIKELEGKAQGKSDKVKALFKDKIKQLKENNTVLK